MPGNRCGQRCGGGASGTSSRRPDSFKASFWPADGVVARAGVIGLFPWREISCSCDLPCPEVVHSRFCDGQDARRKIGSPLAERRLIRAAPRAPPLPLPGCWPDEGIDRFRGRRDVPDGVHEPVDRREGLMLVLENDHDGASGPSAGQVSSEAASAVHVWSAIVRTARRRACASSARRWSDSGSADDRFRGEAQAGLDRLRRAERSSGVGRC